MFFLNRGACPFLSCTVNECLTFVCMGACPFLLVLRAFVCMGGCPFLLVLRAFVCMGHVLCLFLSMFLCSVHVADPKVTGVAWHSKWENTGIISTAEGKLKY